MSIVKCRECGAEISESANNCPHCGYAPKKTPLSAWAAAVIGAVGVACLVINGNDGIIPELKKQPAPKTIAMRFVELNYQVRKTARGVGIEANFSVSNDSAYTIKDIKITCSHYAKSGTKVDSNTRTIYEIIQPKTKKSFRHVRMGLISSHAIKTYCGVADLAVAK